MQQVDLTDSDIQFRALFNHATIGMLVTNQKGEILNFNSFAESQFGYTRQEILGKSIEVLLPEDARQKHVQTREGFMKNPANRPMGANRNLFGRKKDGTIFPVEVSLSHYKAEEETHIIGFIIDISVRKKNELEINEQQQELKRVSEEIKMMNSELEVKIESRTKMLMEALSELETSRQELSQLLQKEKELGDLKSKFVTMASHEFRTPLSTILSSTALLRKYTSPEDGEKREKHLNRIKYSVENMRDILEDFLSLGKMEEGQIQIHPEILTASELEIEIRNIVSELQVLTKKDQVIEFTLQMEGQFPLDLKMLRHVLTNLLSNAIKFSPAGSKIELLCEKPDGNLRLQVKDYGIGIPKADQAHLFERFFRGENAANIQGTGLGLHIISRYMELVQGKIDWISDQGQGTTFILTIPIAGNAEV